jgi:uncharacterized membrane protein YfcA
MESTVVLTAVALATGALTAAIGLGGGMILFVAMLLYLEPLVAIPLHAAVQLVSNGTRTLIQRDHVRWDLLGWYALPLLPLGFLGLSVARALEPRHLEATIGLFALGATWIPRRSGERPDPERRGGPRLFLLLGTVVGFLNVTIGVTGPIVGPFFRGLGLPRQGVVGTFAACQLAGHVAKVLIFGIVGFAFPSYLVLLVCMSAAVAAGTWLGSRLLDRFDERTFRLLYRLALTGISLQLVWEGLRPDGL